VIGGVAEDVSVRTMVEVGPIGLLVGDSEVGAEVLANCALELLGVVDGMPLAVSVENDLAEAGGAAVALPVAIGVVTAYCGPVCVLRLGVTDLDLLAAV